MARGGVLHTTMEIVKLYYALRKRSKFVWAFYVGLYTARLSLFIVTASFSWFGHQFSRLGSFWMSAVSATFHSWVSLGGWFASWVSSISDGCQQLITMNVSFIQASFSPLSVKPGNFGPFGPISSAYHACMERFADVSRRFRPEAEERCSYGLQTITSGLNCGLKTPALSVETWANILMELADDKMALASVAAVNGVFNVSYSNSRNPTRKLNLHADGSRKGPLL